MIKDTAPKAEAGVQNSLDWLSVKIIECMVKPMDDETARNLSAYNAAYNAIKQHANKDVNTAKSKSVHGNSESQLTLDQAKEWCDGMINADGTNGPHWTLENAKKIQAQKGIDGSPIVFWAVINATYSDLCVFFKKYGISTLDAYVDYVKAFWLDDVDAVKNKASVYFNTIVENKIV